MPILESGQLFERYRIIRWLGSGISGESYEAEDSILLRKVTLKLVHPHTTLPDAARRQFFREMQRISIFNHPYLTPILDYGEIHGQLYVARRFVSSGSLLGAEGRLWFRPPLGLADAIRYTRQLADALHYIHQQGYIHGALTFSNILVLHGPDLENDAAPFLISDPGLAQFVRRYGQPVQIPLPITAAPEQFDKRLTPASDQFALAVLLYFWLAGRPPFLGTPEEIEQKKRHEMLTPLSSLNPHITIDLDGVLLRALSAAPEYRYPSVQAFADSLHHTLKYLPEVTEPARFPSFMTPVQTPFLSLFTEATEPIPVNADISTQEAFSSTNDLLSNLDVASTVEPDTSHNMGTIPHTEPLAFLDATTTESVGTPFMASTNDSPTENTDLTSISDIERDEARPYNNADDSHTTSSDHESALEANPLDAPAAFIDLDTIGEAGHREPGRDETRPYNIETATPLVIRESAGADKPAEKPEEPPATEPIPEPTPQVVPDVPQPLPEPDLPEPLPDTGQQEQQQEQEQPPSEEPTVIPPPQPLPNIQQPVPEPETPPEPPVQPPSKETGSNAEQKSLLIARLIIASPYAEEPYEVVLEREEYTIGRAGSSDILLDQDNLTSRHHALLRREDNRYLLYDRRSANGVYVNGQKISSEQGAELIDGDHISIGNYELIFRCPPLSNGDEYQESSEPKMTYSI